MKIYTKTGDSGETALYGGQRVRKDALRVEAYGTVDELNAALGWAETQLKHPEISGIVRRLQRECFVLGGDLATPLSRDVDRETSAVPRITVAETEALEHEIDYFESELAPLTNFILPGGNAGAAALHLARAVCRRAERHIVTLMEHDDIGREVERYINRLSDHLFVLARVVNKRAGVRDVPWSRSEL
ncbi:MAG TPA: cob(I)yrinic acid a,c-diamide adenosyltransferase [Capsulimonadaceae bacterium]|jgi:cob(I)alamin adenosyltransferase